MRRYWQPAALVEELEGPRPVKPVRLLGENLVLFRDEQGRYGLLPRHCPHRGADLAFGRRENGGLRCSFHGWLFDVTGQCLETPAEPVSSPLCRNIKQPAYPVVERSGVLWAYMGPGEPPAFPAFDCFVAPDAYTFAFKGLWECNWLQALEVGIDPAHASYLHRFFEDEDRSKSYGKQFRDASTDTDMPMTQVMREHGRPDIEVEPTDYGLKILTTRDLGNGKTHVRVTNQIFPHAISIPLSQEMMLTQWHVPVDDENCYWYTVFTSFGKPVDKAEMRAQRLQVYELPDYRSKKNREQRLRLRPARAGAQDLHGHGRGHQRARPVGGREPGAHPGPHEGAPGLLRQGHLGLSPAAEEVDRAGEEGRAAGAGGGRGGGGAPARPPHHRRHQRQRQDGHLRGRHRPPAARAGASGRPRRSALSRASSQ